MEEQQNLSFRRVPQEERKTDTILRPPSTYLKDSLYNLSKNPLGMIGTTVIIFMILFAIFGPIVLPYSYDQQNLRNNFQPPSAEHWMGTDNLGRDMTVRIAYGARISLQVGFTASLLSLTIGIFYGAISGFIGGNTDLVMMRFVEIISSVPQILYIILLSQVMPKGEITNIIYVIGLTGWMQTARVVRGDVFSLKTREYVLAARVSGVSNFGIISKHLIPNAIGPIIVSLTMSVPGAIFNEAALRFIGAVGTTIPSWGDLARDGMGAIRSSPHLTIYPSLFISITILAFTLLSDALQQAFDPKKR